MYEDLVERLRTCGNSLSCNKCKWRPECDGISEAFRKAADAIDKLIKICDSLLSKYEEEAEAVIWEYSGHINEDIDELHKEIEGYKAQINGVAEPPKEE